MWGSDCIVGRLSNDLSVKLDSNSIRLDVNLWCPHQLILNVCCQVISWQPFHHLAFNIETVSPPSLGCSISNVLKSCFKTLQLPLIFRFVFDLMLEANDVDVDADVEVIVVEVEVWCWCWSGCICSQSQQATKTTLWPMLVNVLPDPRNFTPL